MTIVPVRRLVRRAFAGADAAVRAFVRGEIHKRLPVGIPFCVQIDAALPTTSPTHAARLHHAEPFRVPRVLTLNRIARPMNRLSIMPAVKTPYGNRVTVNCDRRGGRGRRMLMKGIVRELFSVLFLRVVQIIEPKVLEHNRPEILCLATMSF